MRDMLSTHDRPLKQAPGRSSAKEQPPRPVRTPSARKNDPPPKKGK